jgi:hypothetical protein
MARKRLRLCVISDDKNCDQAQKLSDAGFDFEVRPATDGYRAAYGVPVLFSPFGIHSGVSGIRIFIANAKTFQDLKQGACT